MSLPASVRVATPQGRQLPPWVHTSIQIPSILLSGKHGNLSEHNLSMNDQDVGSKQVYGSKSYHGCDHTKAPQTNVLTPNKIFVQTRPNYQIMWVSVENC